MTTKELAVRALAWAAALLYAVALVAKAAPRTRTSARLSRRLWTLGCALFVLHVTTAFAFVHGWSHAHAYRHTVQRTAELTGIEWGGGLYLNYLFSVVWILDVAWWQLNEQSYLARPRSVEWAIQAFMAFMFVNSVIVFGSMYVRAAGMMVAVVVAFVTLRFVRLRAPP